MPIQPSEYNPFGTLVTGRPERVEASEAEREAAHAADRLTYSDLLLAWKWTDEDFNEAQQYGFPARVGVRSIRRRDSLFSSLTDRHENVFSRAALAVWRERFLGFAAKVR